MAYFYNNSVFLKLEHTDYLDFQWINKKLWEKIKNILICVLKTDKSLISLEWHEGKLIIFVWTIPLRKEDQEWWLSKSDNSKVGLCSAMKKHRHQWFT